MKVKAKTSTIFGFVAGIVLAYFLTYVALSLGGRYQIVMVDLRHAEYGWVPAGYGLFSKHTKPDILSMTIFQMYFPLWVLDQRYIHKNPPPPVLLPVNHVLIEKS